MEPNNERSTAQGRPEGSKGSLVETENSEGRYDALTKTLCPFCQKPNKITNEHLIGKSLRKHLPSGLVRHTFDRVGGPQRTWDTSTFDHKTKAACDKGNNGWMHQLEEAVAPVIVPMIRGERIAIDLKGQILLSAWAVKTAMVAECAETPAKRYFRQAERIFLMKRLVPWGRGVGIHVWLARYGGSLSGITGTAAFLLVPRADGRLESAHVLTLAIGQFAIQVFAERLTAQYPDVLNVRDGRGMRRLSPSGPQDLL